MKNYFAVLCLAFGVGFSSFAQNFSTVKGIVSHAETGIPLKAISISIKNSNLFTLSNNLGEFELLNVPVGNKILIISADGFDMQQLSITIKSDKITNLGTILLNPSITSQDDSGLISLTDNDLTEDGNGGSENTSGILQASRDVFLNIAAFQWGQARFKVRGYDSSNGTILINGITMNKSYDGRPQWSDWGGLNDVMRNRDFKSGLSANQYTFGGLLGTTNFDVRASSFRKGISLSAAATNTNYSNRLMATYASGVDQKGWSYVLSLSRRWANEGYFDGTLYDANSFFIAIEKKLNSHHSINFTAFDAPNRRGKSSPNTAELFNLKGREYNTYWGFQNGKKRNSRIKDLEEPVFVLTDTWKINDNSGVNTSLAYQFGKIGNSRLGYFNAPNPNPDYYRYLPSFFLDSFGQAQADLATTKFLTDENTSQIDWENLYTVNQNHGSSLYYLYEDRSDDKLWSFNSVYANNISNHLVFNVGFNYKNLVSQNFGYMLDLLGGISFTDLDSFSTGLQAQNNINNLDRKVKVGDRFLYNYNLNQRNINLFAQLQFTYKKVDFYLAAISSYVNFWRSGKYENGKYIGNSFGKGKENTFYPQSIKGGITYKITGRHLIIVNAYYGTKAPTLRNAYANVRVNQNIVPNLSNEKTTAIDVSYVFRSPIIKARLSGYYTRTQNVTEIAFFFAQGVSLPGITSTSNDSFFLSQILTGSDKLYFGGEFGLEAHVTPTIKITAAAAVGQQTYDNNPQLLLSADEFGVTNLGTAFLKNYKLANGPQKTYSLGVEYRDPHFWFIALTGNYLTQSYLGLSTITRTNNFVINPQTNQPFDGATQNVVDNLLRQEEFHPYYLLNAIAGKSWRIAYQKYVGFFASVNNITNTVYKSGGFEQSRNANFERLKQDKDRAKSEFGPRYWYGYGTTFYLNFYCRF